MDLVKELVEAWGARVRSHIFGSVVLSFVVINWKVLYYLFFANRPVLQKFRYFDANTDWLSLYLLPIVLGLFLGLSLPFVNNLAHRIISTPVKNMRSRDDELAHDRLVKKNEWEAERNKAKEVFERNLLQEAQIDQEIESLENPMIKNRVQSKIAEVRSSDDEIPVNSNVSTKKISEVELLALSLLSGDGINTDNQDNPFSGLDNEQINRLGVEQKRLTNGKISKVRLRVEFNSTIADLVSKRVVQKEAIRTGNTYEDISYHFTPTVEGYAILDNYDVHHSK